MVTWLDTLFRGKAGLRSSRLRIVPRRCSVRLEVEPLEELTLLTKTWVGPAFGGVWSTQANWKETELEFWDVREFPGGIDSTDDVLNEVIDQLHFTAGNNTIRGNGIPLTINGANLGDNILSDDGNDRVFETLPLILAGKTCYVTVKNHQLTLWSAISGSQGLSLQPASTGILYLTGSASNSYAGTTYVKGGTLGLDKLNDAIAVPHALSIDAGATVQLWRPEQIADTAGVTLNGALNLQDHNETFDALSGSGTGRVSLGTGANTLLTVGAGGGSSTFAGNITGTGSVLKSGIGTLTLSGTNTYAGSTTVLGGILRVDGSVSGTVLLHGGMLGGIGTVGTITAPYGGTVAPGDNGPGILTANFSAVFNPITTFAVELNGPTPGNGAGHHDQLVVKGPVTLSGANLAATLGYVPAPSTSFTILKSTGAISGSFAQGSSVMIGGRPYQIVIDNSSATKTVTLVPIPQPPPLGSDRVVDVTSMVKVRQGKPKRKGGHIKQTVTVVNTSSQRIQGPISLVLDKLTKNVKLKGASGKTTVWAPLKCWYLNLTPTDGVFDPGDSLTFTVQFVLPPGVRKVRFTPRVLGGMGTR